MTAGKVPSTPFRQPENRRSSVGPKGGDPPSLLRVSLTLGGHTYSRDLEPDTAIDLTSDGLSQALAENPARFSWWAALMVRAQALADEAENHRAMLYARLYSRYEGEQTHKGKRPTVEAVRSAVILDQEYQARLTKAAQAREAVGMAKVACATLRKRQDSLMEIAKNLRAEVQAGMRDFVRGPSAPARKAYVEQVLTRLRQRQQGGKS